MSALDPDTLSAAAPRPTQAVILAGGRGTRLLPLTEHSPKPMLAFHDRPFLEYLVEQLRQAGFTRVLLLLGYLPQVVMDHFGDGARFGVEITYSVTDVDNDTGTRLRLADLVTMPTVLAPVYYSCSNECNVLLGTLASVLPQVGLKPGVDYQVLAVSFDERDTPATASKRKGDFFNTTPFMQSGGYPPLAWRFLSGDEANIRRLMDSVGFGFQRSGDAFRHSIALIVLTPTGKISRYLYGIRPLAFDIALAATEAGSEKTGLSVKRAIAMCYTYDPQGRKYVFDFMKVAGAGVLAALGIFGLFLAFGGKKRRPPKV